VLTCADLTPSYVSGLLARFGIAQLRVSRGSAIPASFWGAPEAGIRGSSVYLRDDTPAHSLLHELGHIVCMTTERRAVLDRDAGSDDDEECAVCYLQVLLADYLPGFGRQRCFDDMDAWGYSFREGTACRWFFGDGRSARAWLIANEIIDGRENLLWKPRK
jgi:hypothetical protein